MNYHFSNPVHFSLVFHNSPRLSLERRITQFNRNKQQNKQVLINQKYSFIYIYKIKTENMSENQPLDSGPSFGKASHHQQNIKIPSFSQDQTFLNSIKESKLFDLSQTNFAIPQDKLYQCGICNRLRLVCPFNSNHKNVCSHSPESKQMINQNKTRLHINRTNEFKPINQCRYCSKDKINTNSNRIQINNFTRQGSRFQPKPAVSFIQRPPSQHRFSPKPAVSFIQRPTSQHKPICQTPKIKKTKPLVIEQLIYYPVFHNIYHSSKRTHTVKSTNPESIDKLSQTLASPNSKQRDRRSTKQPQSSPIRVQEYSDMVMTPEKIRELTQSMIN